MVGIFKPKKVKTIMVGIYKPKKVKKVKGYLLGYYGMKPPKPRISP